MHSLSIGDLLEGVTYLVQVQALSRAGPGHVASIHFRTPLLQLVPVGGFAFFSLSYQWLCKIGFRRPCEPWFPHFILGLPFVPIYIPQKVNRWVSLYDV